MMSCDPIGQTWLTSQSTMGVAVVGAELERLSVVMMCQRLHGQLHANEAQAVVDVKGGLPVHLGLQ